MIISSSSLSPEAVGKGWGEGVPQNRKCTRDPGKPGRAWILPKRGSRWQVPKDLGDSLGISSLLG